MQGCSNGVKGLVAGMTEEPILSLYAARRMAGARLILSKRKYVLLVRLSPDVLKKTARAEISYVQN